MQRANASHYLVTHILYVHGVDHLSRVHLDLVVNPMGLESGYLAQGLLKSKKSRIQVKKSRRLSRSIPFLDHTNNRIVARILRANEDVNVNEKSKLVLLSVESQTKMDLQPEVSQNNCFFIDTERDDKNLIRFHQYVFIEGASS